MVLRAFAALVLALMALPVATASAQNVLDFLFGSDPPSTRPAGGHGRSHVPGFSRYEPGPVYDLFLGPFRHDLPQTHERTAYRTLCVRMCDGFFFPVSYSTSSGNFSRDAETCAASCGGEARLFYHPNPGGDIEGMLDLSGRAYASYPTAFKHRKALVQGCQCRPQPWTEAERARHRAYAAAQPLVAVPSPGIVAPPALGVADDPSALARPYPIHRQMPTEQSGGLFGDGSGHAARSVYDRPGRH